MIKSIKEMFDRRRSGIDENGSLTHVRAFLVTSDDINDGPAAALTAAVGTVQVPRFRDGHPKNDGTKAMSLECQPHQDSALHFVVTIDYSVPDNEAQPANPLAAPAEISYGASESTEGCLYDRSPQPADWNPIEEGKWLGLPYANTAGDRFDEFKERESSELVITVVTNEEAYNPNEMETYSHTVNDAVVTIDGQGYAAGTLKLSPITAAKVRENNLSFYKVTKTVKARRDGWDDRLFDIGLNELDYTTPQPPPRKTKCGRRPILDGAGLKISKPWPLNGKGKKKTNPTDIPATLTRRPYSHKDWSNLKWE